MALVAVALTACDPAPPEPLTPRLPAETPSSTKTRIVGLVGSLSGEDSWRGDDAFEGADLAVNELNRSRRPNEPMYELVTLDDGGDARAATRMVEQLAGSSRTVGIVYAGPPEGLPPAEPALAERGIPAILCYGDLYAARQLSPHVFQASPSVLWEARRIASYLLGDRGYTRIGLISEENLSGRTARGATTLALQEFGASITAAVQTTAEPRSVRSALGRLRRSRVQAIILAAAPPAAEAVFDELNEMGSGYQTSARARDASRRRWAPQVAGFDLAMGPRTGDIAPAGTVAGDSYARGAHYLPVPSLSDFRQSFEAWWEEAPLGWEARAFDAVRMIGWASQRARGRSGADLAVELEALEGQRFSGLDITLGPDDHTTVDQTSVGLWVVPRSGIRVYERAALPDQMPWVPLGRGFSIDGERTDIAAKDWEYLFVDAPPKKAPAPRIRRSLFGVTTPSGDPIH